MKIVTDSSVMFSMEEGARRGMAVLPLVVAIDGQSWLEYEDVSAEEFLAKVRAGALPQSASPPPALTLKAYDTDEEVIHLAMADGLSGAYEVACGLVKQARRPDRVHVVNTRTLCVPIGCWPARRCGWPNRGRTQRPSSRRCMPRSLPLTPTLFPKISTTCAAAGASRRSRRRSLIS